MSALRYTSDDRPGIRRIGNGRGFRYIGSDGRRIRDRRTLARIKSLVIPPAWRDVWICPNPDGHLQATGRDARGRKQYLYHPAYRSAQDGAKFDHIVRFVKVLPKVRRAIARDMRRPSLPRRKVLATVVRLLETSLIRVGNDEYTRANGSFGLTTLRDRHVKVHGQAIHFRFRGKSGVMREVELADRRLARIVKACQDLPGQELFQYLDEGGELKDVGSADVNEYLREVAGEDFTAKDFRTWAGTVLAALALKEIGPADSPTRAKRNVTDAIRRVAAKLGNTPTVCRNCYIHPRVIESYLNGLIRTSRRATAIAGLHREEAAVLALLRRSHRTRRARA
jgi:DNA topoisomerase-1